MAIWLRRGVLALAVVLGASQFVRPTMTNPSSDPGRAIHAYLPSSSHAAAVINRSCYDCHSNSTVWPWTSRVAPASWLIAHDVTAGRAAVNFSEWATYESSRQTKLLRDACDEVKEGEMPPLSYTFMHPDAKLTRQDVDAICGAAMQRVSLR